jgi:basic membrane lipoprotein Med (substrate-binding protein (PBP1-ABC) superfamily)
MDRDYFQDALQTFNGGDWYGWKKDWTGEKRMSYENIIIIKEGATMPSEEDVNAKIAELKQEETKQATDEISGKTKLKNLGLTDDEIKALIGK